VLNFLLTDEGTELTLQSIAGLCNPALHMWIPTLSAIVGDRRRRVFVVLTEPRDQGLDPRVRRHRSKYRGIECFVVGHADLWYSQNEA